MKKLLLATVSVVAFVLSCFGQLKVVSDGNALIGSATQNALHKLSIQHTTGDYYRGILVSQPTSSDHCNYGISSSIQYGSGGYKLFGVYGGGYRGSTPTSARSYGVYGIAGNGIDGYNFGIYGHLLGSRNGAAVFGTLYGDPYPYDTAYINGQYAGFFYGDVHIEGDLTVDGSYPISDINLKKDIRPIEEDVISKLEQLQVIRFKKKHSSEYTNLEGDTIDTDLISKELTSDRFTRDRIGLIAQELEVVFPEIVKEGNDGYLRVNYDMLIPILVKGMSQQQKHIEALEAQINNGLEDTKQAFNINTSTIPEDILYESTLYQNIPNPFDENTIIKYSIPEIISYAMLNVYDLQGSQVKSFNITQTGDGEVIIPGSELDPGLFIYNLIVDGVEIGSKRMILTD